MNKCIFFFDFDDTLYSHDIKAATPKTCAALRRLDEMGHIVVIATGRGRETIPLFAKELGYSPRTTIVLNGQVVFEDGAVVYENHMTLDSLNMLTQIAKQQGIAYGGYYWDGVVANTINDRVHQVWADFESSLPLICPNFEQEHNVYQGQLYITKEEQPLFGGLLTEYVTNWSHQYLVNLIPRAAGKSQAVRWCIERYGIQHENTYAFGDGFNDVDMIQSVEHGVAMGNTTSKALLESAEYVTAASSEEGICQALHHYHFI